MEYLGNINLFVSEFVIEDHQAKKNNTQTAIIENQSFQRLLYTYNHSNTQEETTSYKKPQRVLFLETIEFNNFKKVVLSLYSIYKASFPNSEKEGFIKHVFEHTIHEIDYYFGFFKERQFEPKGIVKDEMDYDFYEYGDASGKVLFALNPKRDINSYRLYYTKVLNHLRLTRYSQPSINLKRSTLSFPMIDMVSQKSENDLSKSSKGPTVLRSNYKRGKTPTRQQISFNSPDTITRLHEVLKGHFHDRDADLLLLLKGEEVKVPLFFNSYQNKLVEVFLRAKYNGYIVSSFKEIEEWLCSNFTYFYQKGSIREIRPLNKNTVHDILTKGRSIPNLNARICKVDWLEFKSYDLRKKQRERENL